MNPKLLNLLIAVVAAGVGAGVVFFQRGMTHAPEAAGVPSVFRAEGILGEAEVYRTAQVGDLILTDAPPAGVFYRFDLDPTKQYAIEVQGINVEGQATIRMRKDEDDEQRSYSSAPNGVWTQEVSAVKQLELLVYSDRPFQYALESISISETEKTPGDEVLRAEVMAAIPELERLLVEDRFEAARQILNWVSNNVAQAESRVVNLYSRRKVSASPASWSYYRLFQPNQGGVFCGGMAVFCDKVFKLFGFDSFTLNYGLLADALTHVTCVINFADDRGDARFYVFDPTFNLTYRDSSGEYLDLAQMLEADPKSVVFEERSLAGREFVSLKSLQEKVSSEERAARLSAAEQAIERGEEIDLVSRKRDFDVDRYLVSFGPALEKNGYTPDRAGFLAVFRARVFSAGCSGETKRSLARLLAQHEIPFGREE